MALVATSQNLNAVSRTAGEAITIVNGATLTIDAQEPLDVTALATYLGTTSCTTSGKLRILNDSTTTPLVVTLTNSNSDLRFEGNGILEIRGNMIEIGTGNGASQSWDFSSLFSGALTDVTYVEVEQVAGSGDYIPWHIAEVASRYYRVGSVSNRGAVITDFDGNQPIFFYNSDTRVLSCGDNTNGLAVPTGCKIRIPNILITNQDWQPDAALIHGIVSEGTPTGGTFTITVINGRTGSTLGTTGAIAFNASGAAIDAALEAVLGAGTISTTGGPLPTNVGVTLTGAYASTPLRFQVNSSVTGGTNSVVYSLENAATNMSLLDLNPSGTLDAECVMFSQKISTSNTSFSSIRALRVGIGCGTLSFTSSNGNLTLDHFNFTSSPYVPQSPISVGAVFGQVFRRKVVSTTSLTQSAATVSSLPNLIKEEDTRHLQHGQKTSTSAINFTYTAIPPIEVVRGRYVGGRLNVANSNDVKFLDCAQSDHPGTAQLSAIAVDAVTLANCSGVLFNNFSKAGTAACRSRVFAPDSASKNLIVYNSSYDGSNNSSGIISQGCDSVDIRNSSVTNIRTGGIFYDAPSTFAATNAKLQKVFGTAASTEFISDSCQGGIFDLVSCSPTGFNEVNASVENFVGGNFTTPGLTPTTGHVTFGAFGRGSSLDVTGSTFTNQIGSIYLQTDGDTAVTTMPFDMHGITGFQNVNPQFIAELEGGFSNAWRIINDGGVTGGSFTLTFYDSSDTLIGTTSSIVYNASTTTVDTAVEAVLGSGTVSVSGTLSTGFIITRASGVVIRCTADGSGLTGGTKPGIAKALSRHNVGVAAGTALLDTTSLGPGLTVEFGMKTPSGSWSVYQTLNQANLISEFAALTDYDPNEGLNLRLRFTAVGNDEYRRIQQVTMPTTVDPDAWILGDASITLSGPLSTDVTKIMRASDNTELYSFTGFGEKEFSIGPNYGVEVYLRRETSGGTVLMLTLPQTYTLKFGNNGEVPLFYGAEIQLAQSSEVAAIKTAVDLYLDAAISSRLASVGYTAPPTASANASAVRTELTTELGRIDVATSTRLATAGYTTPPTAAAIRSEIDTSSTKLDVAVGTRLASASYVAPANSDITAIKAKTDNLPSDPADESSIQAAIAAIPTAPSASTVASAVRTELTTELGRIDVATSTRLAAVDYTAAPTASANATAVRSELATELARIDVATSTRNAIAPLDSTATQAAAAAALNAYDPPTKAELDSAEADIIAALPAAAPSASTVASAVRTELTTELGRIDVATSTRLAGASYTAPANADISAIKAKTDNLPSDPADESSIQAAIAAIPTAPSASTVASAVRTELTTELGRIDANISSRATPTNITDARDAVQADIAALNDLSAADVKAEADQALVDYDAPTKAELDSATSDIQDDIAAVKTNTDLIPGAL